MASKRRKKVKKRQKALQRRRRQQHPTRTPRPVPQMPPEHADHFAMTTTGEIMQPIRLHYEVLDGNQLRAIFLTLHCLDHDAPRKRWVWLYMEEARGLSFKDTRAADNTVLGEFVFQGSTEVVLNLRSFERAAQAIELFDQLIPRTVARVAAMTISNRLLSVAEASALTSLDRYFERADVVVQAPETLVDTLKDLATRIPDERERLAAARHYMEDKAKQPVPALERFPFDYDDYDEGGIRVIEARLAPHTVMAMQHWQGNTDYTRYDLIQDMLGNVVLPKGETDRHLSKKTPVSTFGILDMGKRFLRFLYRKMYGRSLPLSTTEPSVDASLTPQLCALMRSDDYTDWLQAWDLIRDTLPESITTFGALDAFFGLHAHACSVTDLFYTLEMELHNEGLKDVRLTATRADLARWVYTHFTEESMLHLGNFRSYEAQSLWDMGQRDEAEARFQEVTEVFPNFAWGYIWWGDCYWMSDWSYVSGPDYDRAGSLYRQALANPDLDDRGGVQDRLDDLHDEQVHPENREKIKQTRLRYIQHRKTLE